jgi:predicted ATPase/DNA-binding NarL/FixJ family response regulator
MHDAYRSPHNCAAADTKPMAWPNNLPAQLSTFVGREREAEDLLGVLRSARLVTLTGPGGAGKTRLAIEAASRAQQQFPDGAWFVNLGSIFEPALVPGTVADALGVREEPGLSLQDTLAAFLAPRSLLLVLDNCEHLLKTCAALGGFLLRSCPELRVLATSREPLSLQGETVVRVPPLSIPSTTAEQDPEDLLQYDSVRLFVSRAHQRTGDFHLTPDNAPAVALLARQLDGLPLAIELAAARASVLSVDQILERLGERFRLLASHDSDVIPRHRTLEATIDWSYELLSPGEQALFRALSVFAGGFTLDAACALVAPALDEPEVIDVLSQLVGKSLVSLDPAAAPARYRVLETVRRFALERARESGDLTGLRDRHLELYTILAERNEDRLLSSAQGDALAYLAAEYDNMRSALAWALESLPASRDLALRLAGSLGWFWYFRGYLSEGRDWLERVLTSVGDLGTTARAGKALSAGGVMAYLQTDDESARAWLERAVEFWTLAGDKRGLGFALTFLARVLDRQGDPRSLEVGERSVELFREIGDKWPLALALDFLGEVAREHGAVDEAAALHTESLSLYREIGNRWGIALELSHFAQVAIHRGEYQSARRRLEEAAEIQREVGDKWMLAWTLHYLVIALASLGQRDEAESSGLESLRLFREAGDRNGIAAVLAALARLAYDNGLQDEARTYAEESLTVAATLGRSATARDAQAVLAGIMADSSDYSEGALPIPGHKITASGHARSEGIVRADTGVLELDPSELTPREVDVLTLLAEGLTDAQIADRLVLSTRTVQAHLRSVYSKLNVTTRTAAARYALTHGMG